MVGLDVQEMMVAQETWELLDSTEMQVTQVSLGGRARRESSERRATEEQRGKLDTKDCREPKETEAHRDRMAQLVQLVILAVLATLD